MKKTNKFIASNGLVVEYNNDSAASKPLTAKELENAKVISNKNAGITPEFIFAMNEAAKFLTRGRPKKSNPKIAVKLRVDPKVLNAYKAKGKGWQTRMHDVLRASVEGQF